MAKKNLNIVVQKSVRQTQQLSIDAINREIANNWFFLSSKQKKALKDLIIDTWNYGAKYNRIYPKDIKIPAGEKNE